MFAPLRTENGWTVVTDLLKSPCSPTLMLVAKLAGRAVDNLTEAEAKLLTADLNRWYCGQTERKKDRR